MLTKTELITIENALASSKFELGELINKSSSYKHRLRMNYNLVKDLLKKIDSMIDEMEDDKC